MFEKLARAKILIAKLTSGHAEERCGPSFYHWFLFNPIVKKKKKSNGKWSNYMYSSQLVENYCNSYRSLGICKLVTKKSMGICFWSQKYVHVLKSLPGSTRRETNKKPHPNSQRQKHARFLLQLYFIRAFLSYSYFTVSSMPRHPNKGVM